MFSGRLEINKSKLLIWFKNTAVEKTFSAKRVNAIIGKWRGKIKYP